MVELDRLPYQFPEGSMSHAGAQPQDLFHLAAVTPAELAAIATAAAGSPVARPAAHPVPIAYDWGSPVTAGLWRVEVTSDAEPACVLFVKLVRHTRLWPMLGHLPDEASRAEFVSYYPWHYELDIHQAGIESVLPDGMRMPVLHHVTRPDDDHMGLWWEFIRERPGGWELADYRLAARLLGQLAARRRAGAEVNKALPEVARNRASALRFYTSRRVISGVLPALRAGEIWHHPVLQAALGQAADPALPADMLALGERLPQLLDMLDELPQTHAHGDASPQNLLLPQDEPGTVAVIDWGFGTLLPVGFDLGQLLVGLAHARDTDLSQLPAIDAEIFPAYLDGLASEDYKADPAHVRTGYIGSLAARSALCAIPAEQLSSAAPSDDTVALFARRIRLTRLMLDLAREV
jgi:Phosphotransferase enzyme family